MVGSYNFSIPKKNKLDFYSSFYSYPYFHQNWNLFTPVPKQNFELFAFTNGKTINVLGDILNNHQKNRLAGEEALLLAFTNSIHYFFANRKIESGSVLNDKNFIIIEFSTRNYIKQKYLLNNQNIKLLLMVKDIRTNHTLYFYNKWQ